MCVDMGLTVIKINLYESTVTSASDWPFDNIDVLSQIIMASIYTVGSLQSNPNTGVDGIV